MDNGIAASLGNLGGATAAVVLILWMVLQIIRSVAAKRNGKPKDNPGHFTHEDRSKLDSIVDNMEKVEGHLGDIRTEIARISGRMSGGGDG